MGSKFSDFLNFDAVDLDRQKDTIVPLHINATLFTLACAVSEPQVRLLIQNMKPKRVRYIFFVSNQHACTFLQDLCIHSEHLTSYLNAIGQEIQPSLTQVHYQLDAREWMWHIRHQFELPKFECKSNIIIIALIVYINARIIRISELGRLFWEGFSFTSKIFRFLAFQSMTGEDRSSSTPFFCRRGTNFCKNRKINSLKMSNTALSPDATTTSTPAAPLKSPRDGKKENFAIGKQVVQPSGSTPVNQHNKIILSSVRISPSVKPIRQRQPIHILHYVDDTVHDNVSSYSGELLALSTTFQASADLSASISVYSDCMSATHTALAAYKENKDVHLSCGDTGHRVYHPTTAVRPSPCSRQPSSCQSCVSNTGSVEPPVRLDRALLSFLLSRSFATLLMPTEPHPHTNGFPQ